MNKFTPIYLACIFLVLAVALGAFGAHALKSTLEASSSLDTWRTAVDYHFYHGIGLLILGMVYSRNPVKSLRLAIIFLASGIVLFSGSLYLLCTAGWTWLGPVTPLGGVLFIVGWLVAAVGIKTSIEHA